MTSSTLVETISINYEDFNDIFLTCGTCLCIYDAGEHTPKLLSCSHTVCKNCLDRIVEVQGQETGTFRCPICRDSIRIPTGGVNAFPPSFLVNQLIDLISSQPREVIPKCSIHPGEELLFCETCDKVFCEFCAGSGHNGRGVNEHTVIPFAIAIKRMSEILLYKAQLCIKTLTTAYDNICNEMSRLETSVEKAVESINTSCQDVISSVDKRRHECLTMVRKIHNEKRKVLSEQLDIIQAEKNKVQDECDNMQFQVEVRNISKKIGDLNEKIDSLTNLLEPRENSFLSFEFKYNDCRKIIADALSQFGSIRVSTTFPALSTAFADRAVAHLQSAVHVSTVDYHGNPRSTGGDPITALLRSETGELLHTKIRDNDDGTYAIVFVPPPSKTPLKMNIKIFERPIKDSPIEIQVSEHNNPLRKFGTRGSGHHNLSQPVRICVSPTNRAYVLDTGNNRIKCLDKDLNVLRHIGPTGLENQSSTGLALTNQGEFIVINWRSKLVTRLDHDGNLVTQFTSSSFVEPIDVAVNSRNDIIVADNGSSKVFIFDQSGKLTVTFGGKGDRDGLFGLISAVAIGRCDEILVADHRIQIFTRDGKFSRQIPVSDKGTYGGVCVDSTGQIYATRTEKSKNFIVVYNSSGKVQFAIDSHNDRLKRPGGLSLFMENCLLVADLGNDSIKQFRCK